MGTKTTPAEPNPQNIPIRTPDGKRIRDLFVKRRPSWWALAWLAGSGR
jgi:DNA polymerase I-like protein with 3'-5' exonuclease and polymerase domains